jgi:hypothetical protein
MPPTILIIRISITHAIINEFRSSSLFYRFISLFFFSVHLVGEMRGKRRKGKRENGTHHAIRLGPHISRKLKGTIHPIVCVNSESPLLVIIVASCSAELLHHVDYGGVGG